MHAFIKGNSHDIKDEKCVSPSGYEKSWKNSAQ